jgi:hypothetical protein
LVGWKTERSKEREKKEENIVWLKKWRERKLVGANSFSPELTKFSPFKLERKQKRKAGV